MATAGKSLALAVSDASAPLRQWGDEVDLTEASPQPALYSWEAAAPEESRAMPTNESTFGEVKASGTRSYSRLRVYALAALVAVIIVGVYMVVVGIDEQPSDSGAAQDVPTAESESAPVSEPESPAAPEPDSSAPAAEESTEPAAAATEQAPQPANSLTLTFDSPPSSPTLTEPAAD